MGNCTVFTYCRSFYSDIGNLVRNGEGASSCAGFTVRGNHRRKHQSINIFNMADQPAKALILYGDGFMKHVAPRHSHLHALAEAGSCGFLALRSQAVTVQEDQRVVGELAQLLDLHDVHQRIAGNEANQRMPSMSERFMKMKAGMLSNCEPAAAFGNEAGFSILSLQDEASNSLNNSLPEPSTAAARLLSHLDLQDANDDEKRGDFELVLLHLKASQQEGGESVVEWTNELLGVLQNLSSSGSKAGSHLYLIVVLGYGSVSSDEGEGVASLLTEDVLEPKLAQLLPRQSYTIKAGQLIEGIREHHPLLVVYHLNAVTRRDEVNSFTFEEFKQHGGNLTIFVDRFLHEVAFKLWRAPKYGA